MKRATTETNTAHFYPSLCSIHVPKFNTKLYACVVFSKVTETRYPLEFSQELGSGVIRDT